MTTIHRKGKVYTGNEKVDRGYLRPVLLDLTAATGSGTVTHWDGTGAKPAIAGPGLLIGDNGSAVEGEYWKKTSTANNNTDWVAF